AGLWILDRRLLTSRPAFAARCCVNSAGWSGPSRVANWRPPRGSCVASDFARQIPVSFRPHLTGWLAFTKEAIVDDDDTAQAEAVLDSRAEVRLVGADADRADLRRGRGGGGGGGSVGDHPDPGGGPR